jgi:hypothetical protein
VITFTLNSVKMFHYRKFCNFFFLCYHFN